MAANGDEPFPKAGGFRPSPLLHWLSDCVNFRLLLNARAARRSGTRNGPEERLDSQGAIKASDYLETCREKALDAYTIEDAIYWHNEIITELTVELHSIHRMNWPDTVKASMMVALEDRLNQHASAVTRLAGILERNEKFIWQP